MSDRQFFLDMAAAYELSTTKQNKAHAKVRRLFTWWDGWTADMDLIGPLVRVADYQP